MYYIADSNIWVDVTQGKISCSDLRGKPGVNVVVAPFMIVELMRSTVRGGEKYFSGDKAMFQCMSKFDIQQLTKPFIFKVLWNVSDAGTSGVYPETYRILLRLMTGSNSFRDFISKTEAPGSVWTRVSEWDLIHEGVLDKELKALGTIARGASVTTLHMHMARLYKLGGLLPDPGAFDLSFSAALEYLRASVLKLRTGANLARNDRGMYVDFQLFFYLADPEAVIVSNERFTGEIVNSPQRSRIISFEQFRRL